MLGNHLLVGTDDAQHIRTVQRFADAVSRGILRVGALFAGTVIVHMAAPI
jgi:hypothetical protein